MLVHSWPLSTEMWDGEVLAGPIPTLFSEDPISTMEAIKKETAKLHWDLSKLYKVGIHTHDIS
jgi:hypothetical protein